MTLQELTHYLNNHKLYVDVEEIETHFIINVEWGDWKHDHRYLQNLMSNLNFILDMREITNTDGSDCFSAIYYYKKNNL